MGREGVRAAVTTLAWTYQCGFCCLRNKGFGIALGPVRREEALHWPLSLHAIYEGPRVGVELLCQKGREAGGSLDYGSKQRAKEESPVKTLKALGWPPFGRLIC